MRFFLLSILLLLIACQDKEQENNFQFSSSRSIKTDTTTLRGIDYILDYDTSQILRVWNSEKGLLLESKEEAILPNSLIFEDINQDGYEDIYFLYSIATGLGANNLLLYDTASMNFKYVDGIANQFDNLIRIDNSPYYYAYAGQSCADYRWESFLFTIQDFSAFELAYMEGLGCDDDELGIYIYDNSDHQHQVLIEKSPMIEPNQKFKFIHEYWTKNWNRLSQF